MPKRRAKGGDVAEKIYDATAAFGVFMALLSAIGGTLISLILIAVGIYMLQYKDPYEGKTFAKVTASKCNTKDKNTTCVIDYEYTVDNKAYKLSSIQLQGTYVSGNTVNMLYDKKNPDNHKLNPTNWKLIGWICIGIGIFIVIAAWVWFYITRTYKIAAAANGVGTVADIAIPNE